MMKLGSIKIKTKLILIMIIIIIAFSTIALSNFFLINTAFIKITDDYVEDVSDNIQTIIETTINVSIKSKLNSISSLSLDFIKSYYERSIENGTPKDEAVIEIKKIFSNINIGKSGYIYILDISKTPNEVKLVLHPKMEGQDVSELEFIKTIVSVKEGYLSYDWKNPGEENERPKFVSMVYFQEWDWIVCVSAYRDEFDTLTNIDDFKDKILSVKIGESGYVTIADKNGNFIIHKNHEGDNLINDEIFSKEAVNKFKEIFSSTHGKIEYIVNQNEGNNKKRTYYRYIEDLEWMIMVTVFEDELYSPVNKQGLISIITFVIILIITAYLIYIMVNNMKKPINKIISGIKRLKEGDLDYVFEIKQDNELKELSDTLNNMTSQLKTSFEKIELQKNEIIEYNRVLEIMVDNKTTELLKKNEQMKKELSMARRVQLSLIPNSGNFPQRDELEFASKYLSMEEVGGDLYDVIRIGKNGYAFLMIDVSGHGVPAALITSMAKVLFHSYSGWNKNPSEVCRKINNEIYNFIGDLTYFITAFYCTINLETGRLEYTNGGHHPAIIYRKDTQKIEKLDTDGFIMGAFKNAIFETKSLTLNYGDRLLLFTDGLIETKNKVGESYQYKRLMNFIKNNSHLKPQKFVDRLINNLSGFSEGEEPQDDLAILYIEYKNPIPKENELKQLSESLNK